MTRDEKGRFVKGQSGNPGGRPKDEAARLLRQALCDKMTPQRAATIAEKMLTMAERGDSSAVERLFKFLGLFEDAQLNVNLTVRGFDELLKKVYGNDG